jgi:hypothetical protein
MVAAINQCQPRTWGLGDGCRGQPWGAGSPRQQVLHHCALATGHFGKATTPSCHPWSQGSSLEVTGGHTQIQKHREKGGLWPEERPLDGDPEKLDRDTSVQDRGSCLPRFVCPSNQVCPLPPASTSP